MRSQVFSPVTLLVFAGALAFQTSEAKAQCGGWTQQAACVAGDITGVTGSGTFSSIQEAICVQPSSPSSACVVGLPGAGTADAIWEDVQIGHDRWVRIETTTVASTVGTPAKAWFSDNSSGGWQLYVYAGSRIELVGGPPSSSGNVWLQMANDTGAKDALIYIEPGGEVELDGVVLHRPQARLVEIDGGTLEASRSVLAGISDNVVTEPFVRASGNNPTIDFRDMEIRGDAALNYFRINGTTLVFSWPDFDDPTGPTGSLAEPNLLIEMQGGSLTLQKSKDPGPRGQVNCGPPKRQARQLSGGRQSIRVDGTTLLIADTDIRHTNGNNVPIVELLDASGVIRRTSIWNQGATTGNIGLALVDGQSGGGSLLIENTLITGMSTGVELHNWVDDSWVLQHNTVIESSQYGMRFNGDYGVTVRLNAVGTMPGSLAGAIWFNGPTPGAGNMTFEDNGFGANNGIGPVQSFVFPGGAATEYPNNDIYSVAPGVTVGGDIFEDDQCQYSPFDNLDASFGIFSDPNGSSASSPNDDRNRVTRAIPAGSNADQGCFED